MNVFLSKSPHSQIGTHPIGVNQGSTCKILVLYGSNFRLNIRYCWFSKTLQSLIFCTQMAILLVSEGAKLLSMLEKYSLTLD